MPSSRPDHIPLVISLVRQLRPRSILELGVGFGKWGHLFREYTDIVAAETDPPRYQRDNWQIRIDGIEAHRPYLTPAHQYLYNQLLLGDMRELIHQVGLYDLIFLGDAIEHVEKEDGRRLLHASLDHARLAVIVTTPARPTRQQAACGNPLEVHRSFWTPAEFRALGCAVRPTGRRPLRVGRPAPAQAGGCPPLRCLTKTAAGDTLVAVLLKPGVAAPRMTPRRGGSLWERICGRTADTEVGRYIRRALCRSPTAGQSEPLTQVRGTKSEPLTPVRGTKSEPLTQVRGTESEPLTPVRGGEMSAVMVQKNRQDACSTKHD